MQILRIVSTPKLDNNVISKGSDGGEAILSLYTYTYTHIHTRTHTHTHTHTRTHTHKTQTHTVQKHMCHKIISLGC